MDKELDDNWKLLIEKLKVEYGEELDLQSIIFLIGIQELGQGYKKYNKNQKLDIMHVAICTLLSEYGFYEFEGHDADGWPHWKATEKLPNLKPSQQSNLMKESVVEYFKKREFI